MDYKVYSDTVNYASPYDRHTYRYTPFISYMMRWNYTHHETIGKLSFVGFDVIAMVFLWGIIGKGLTEKDHNSADESTEYSKEELKQISRTNFITKLYGYNPLLIYLTVRGSCESISLAFMYMFWFFFFGKVSTKNK